MYTLFLECVLLFVSSVLLIISLQRKDCKYESLFHLVLIMQDHYLSKVLFAAVVLSSFKIGAAPACSGNIIISW